MLAGGEIVVLLWEELAGRNSHEAGRALLEKAYRQKYGGELPEIMVTDRGKPYFPNVERYFSISHTKNRVFCCLAEMPVGLDAEQTERKIPLALAEKILSATEKARISTARDPNAALLRLWVLKEAFAKLTGRGWGNYLYQTDFDPDDPRIRILGDCYVAVLTKE